MKSVKLGVWVLLGMGLAMLLSVGFLGSEGSISAQDSTDPVFVGAGDIASCARTAACFKPGTRCLCASAGSATPRS